MSWVPGKRICIASGSVAKTSSGVTRGSPKLVVKVFLRDLTINTGYNRQDFQPTIMYF